MSQALQPEQHVRPRTVLQSDWLVQEPRWNKSTNANTARSFAGCVPPFMCLQVFLNSADTCSRDSLIPGAVLHFTSQTLLPHAGRFLYSEVKQNKECDQQITAGDRTVRGNRGICRLCRPICAGCCRTIFVTTLM